ncbi:hypothetical protein MCOR27_011245 [Pyricularia oryzae]|uniref:Uncharacterized protein n=1 Tax=Pyricularia grisea TaxID=148305 RepID=A0ABQ8N3E8_PYRGI|nr:hypothetical protein MCOR01_000931 [Pyricularia oryzae]KAI6290626.1 hypothetical protein MCOR33_011169 [Pyricularia grisea]KAH9427261.1 hypothetical protein MCOR02_012383 [Pyricularia oryzae]KAI6252294.1 hypothetical protein MCOR19_011095 [Pyricularia oryzae]KAI6265854.1 hypothetical protein MCOR27_011245 [Pyricularia oryzae]
MAMDRSRRTITRQPAGLYAELEEPADIRPSFVHPDIPFNPHLTLLLPKNSLGMDDRRRTPSAALAKFSRRANFVLYSQHRDPRCDPDKSYTPPYDLDGAFGETHHQLPGLTSRDKQA